MKAEWVDCKYSCYRLDLTSGLSVQVNWGKEGFKVSFDDRSLATEFPNLADAKRAGEELARETLMMAIHRLPEAAQ